MAELDWTSLVGELDGASVLRAVTAGTTPPNGGGSFIRGANSLQNNTGVVGQYHNGTGFAPTAKGGEISGALMRGTSAGTTGYAVFLFAQLGGTNVADTGYILGLSDGSPGRIVLRKGSLATGLPDEAPGTGGVLARSDESVANDVWAHVRMEMVVNLSGDVVINVYRSDLGSNPVTSPVWVPVPGMDGFSGGVAATAIIDDALGVNTGSVPLTAGRMGYGHWSNDVSRRSYVDHIKPERQL